MKMGPQSLDPTSKLSLLAWTYIHNWVILHSGAGLEDADQHPCIHQVTVASLPTSGANKTVSRYCPISPQGLV